MEEEIISLDKKHIHNYFFILLLLEFLIYIIITSIPFKDPSLLSSFKSEQSSITSQTIPVMFMDIFLNNFRVASIEVIPIIGPFFYIASGFATALIISLEGGSYNISGIFVFISLLLFPHSWLELPSYAVAVSISIYLTYSLIKIKEGKEILKKRLIKSLLLYGFVAVELAVAAIFESVEIYFETTQSSPNNLLYPLLMWIPAVPALIFLIFLFHRINGPVKFRKKNVIPKIEEKLNQ